MTKGRKALQLGAFFLFFCALLVSFLCRKGISNGFRHFVKSRGVLTKEFLASALRDQASFYRFPNQIDLPISEKTKVHAVIQYAFDPKLQETMEGLFRSYSPDFGAFVAMDAKTGRVLSMVSYARAHKSDENLTLRATFPSASVFKVVTAAAAIENQKFSADTIVSYNGRNHTLYRSNVLRSNVTRWTRYITLKEAFAHSINTVFAKIGAFSVGPEELKDYADRFGFNRKIAADVQIQEGHAEIPSDSWGLAESASGFTRDNTMSPLQGALIASAIINDGVIMEPYIVQSVYSEQGMPLYLAEPKISKTAIDAATATQIRALMKETIVNGTSRGSFRGFLKTKKFAGIDVGGKTGSLTGTNPRGKYDWFVGFAELHGQKVAVAALTVHEKLWRVKSSYLARRAFETYFANLQAESRGKDVAGVSFRDY